MYYSIDRFEGQFAVCEDENGMMKDIPVEQLPENLKEGNVLRYENGIFVLDEDEEKRRREAINKIQRTLWDE